LVVFIPQVTAVKNRTLMTRVVRKGKKMCLGVCDEQQKGGEKGDSFPALSLVISIGNYLSFQDKMSVTKKQLSIVRVYSRPSIAILLSF
jgi:hypothetical protein